MATTTTQPHHLTAYVKLTPDADNGIAIQDDAVYFGGWHDDHAEAEQAARDCVNVSYDKLGQQSQPRGDTTRGTVLPRVFAAGSGETLIDVMYRAAEWFEHLVQQMRETDEIIAHTAACRS